MIDHEMRDSRRASRTIATPRVACIEARRASSSNRQLPPYRHIRVAARIARDHQRSRHIRRFSVTVNRNRSAEPHRSSSPDHTVVTLTELETSYVLARCGVGARRRSGEALDVTDVVLPSVGSEPSHYHVLQAWRSGVVGHVGEVAIERSSRKGNFMVRQHEPPAENLR